MESRLSEVIDRIDTIYVARLTRPERWRTGEIISGRLEADTSLLGHPPALLEATSDYAILTCGNQGIIPLGFMLPTVSEGASVIVFGDALPDGQFEPLLAIAADDPQAATLIERATRR